MSYDYGYTRYSIVELSDELVEVHFETNDDEDTGDPGVFAEEIYTYRGEGALEKALKHCGKSRQGIGQRVFVTLNGKEI